METPNITVNETQLQAHKISFLFRPTYTSLVLLVITLQKFGCISALMYLLPFCFMIIIIMFIDQKGDELYNMI